MGIVCLDFSKAFNTVSCTTHMKKLIKCGLDEQAVRWTKNSTNSWTQTVMISDMKSR